MVMAERGIPEMECEAPAIEDGPLKFSTGNLKYQMQQFIKSCGKPVKILLSGKTGVGKSHLTNALIGEELAEEGKVDPQTDEVTAYGFIKNNVSITVFDTPGLADATSNDDEYLRKIKEKAENDFDLFLFCTEMNSTRFPRTDDLETMKKLTQTLGVKLWDHAVVVLTFANMVLLSPSEKAKGVNEKDAFNSQFQCLKKRIQQALIKIGVPEDVAVNVPVVPTGDVCEPRLPDRDNWLTAFWVAAFNRINRNAKAAFLLSNADRIEFSPVLDADEEIQESMVIRALENTFQGVAFEKDLVPSLPNPRPSVAAGKSSSCPPQNQTVTRTASTIQLDEACSRSIINDMVGDVTGTSSGESKGPAFVRFYQPFLIWILKYLRKLFRNRSGKEAGINDDQSGGKK